MAQLIKCPRGHEYESPSGAGGDWPCPRCAAERRAQIAALPMSGDPDPPAPATSMPQFPGLQIIEEISPGVGGMGVVYKAREVSLDRIVAVKTTRSRLQTADGLAFFQREARSAARLDHPNILRIFRFSPEHTPPFYVMEFLEGRHLDRACRGRDFRYVAALMEKIARALAYAHAKGVVHRDIKPGNILVDADDEPHIADFGVAGYFGDLPHDSAASGPTLVGTPGFIAPEVYEGASGIGPEIDVYALGVTLYELLAHRVPFAGRLPQEVRAAVLAGNPPLPQEINPSVPEPLQRICLAAMDREPSARYASAAQMADDLRRFLDGKEIAARPSRYQQELRGRLQTHLADVHLWQQQSLIDVREMDRLARPIHALLESVSPWLALSRRFPWETIMLRLGGWLVLISSVLWPAFYWATLSRAQRVLVVGLPALAMNAVGWLLRWRGSRANSVIYLSTGALLLPLLASVVLTEYRMVPHAQPSARELFGQRTQDATGPAADYAPTNLQLTISAGIFCAYCGLLLAAMRAKLLAVWLAAGLYLAYCGLLLLAGLKQWIADEHVARALLLMLCAALAFWPMALLMEWTATTRPWATVFFAFFVVPLVLIVSLLARYGAAEWLHAQPSLDDETINQWLMADGLIYFIGGLWCTGARSSYVRFWGGVLMLLVPVHLLTPTQMLFDKRELFILGAAAVTLYELASFLLAVALVVLGTRLRQQAIVLPALVGLAVVFFRATGRHFQDHRGWPLSIAVTGTVAMTVALVSLLWRAHKRKESI